jgi:4-amino-4-deoxy-L-arabinose transferase-like glycosyltransferase
MWRDAELPEVSLLVNIWKIGLARPRKAEASPPRLETQRPARPRRTWPFVVLVACLLIFMTRSLASLTQECATWDETSYFGLGKYLLQHQRWDIPGAIIHPPLSYYLHSIPLLFVDTDPGLWKYPGPRSEPVPPLQRGRLLLSSPANQGDRLLTQARAMMVFVAVLLGYFVYSWSYSLYGKWCAVLAAVLYTFCPNILANAHLITPDIAVTTFSFVTVYFLWSFLKENRRRDAIVGGVCLGLTLLSKFTGALLPPICLGLMALWWTRGQKLDLWGCLLFMAIGILVLWLGYGMDLWPYFSGIGFQRAHAAHGHPSFFMGEYSKSGWWYYPSVAFVLKTPLAAIVLLAISLVRLVRRARSGVWIDEAFLLIPVLVVFAFFSVNHQSIGLRYILPIYPFLFVLASESARAVASDRVWVIGLRAVLVAWYLGASFSIQPHYLAYFNELVGGASNGYKYLVDSNLDWGQDLKGLKRYMEEHGISKISLSYFGTDSPERYGISYSWLPSVYLDDPNPEGHEPAPGGWVAISATNLQGVYFSDKNLFASMRTRIPDAKIGYSIFVYHLNEQDATALFANIPLTRLPAQGSRAR